MSSMKEINSYHDYAQATEAIRKEERKRTYWISLSSAIVCFVLGVFITVQVYGNLMPQTTDVNLAKLMSIYDLIKNEWYFGEEGTEQEYLERALAAMVNEQDEDYYLHYYEASEEETPTEVTYGIGVEVVSYDGYLKVQSVYTNSPAEQAGLFTGDIITGVDGTSIRYLSLNDVVTLIKGERETNVVLTLLRDRVSITRTVERNSFIEDSVYTSIDSENQVGVLKLTGFEDNTYVAVDEALETMSESGVNRLLIDLRDNPGGYVMVFTQIANLLTPKGSVYGRYVYKDDSKSYDVISETSPSYSFDRIVILVNSHSASASESLTAALADNIDTCVVVGETSYGKGIAQKTISFSDGSSLKYTYAEFYRNDGTRLHQVGIVPDVLITESGLHLDFNREYETGDSYETRVQELLTALSYSGEDMTSLVSAFQEANELSVTGTLDNATKAKIQAILYDLEQVAKRNQLDSAIAVLRQ